LRSTPLRIEVSIEEMARYYPQLKLTMELGVIAAWRGRVQPLQTENHLTELLDDIANDRAVQVLYRGEVQHHPDCTAHHQTHEWMSKIIDSFVSYELLVRYSGGRIHPRAYVLEPAMTKLGHPHRFSDGTMCPYRPTDGVWLWREHTVVDFMDHAMIWLVKHNIWSQTGIWIGAEAPHDIISLLRTTGQKQECFCRSGKPFGKCHLSQMQNHARRHYSGK
jgi:hypothetical protein